MKLKMKKKRTILLVVMIMLAIQITRAQQCNSYNTPKLVLPSYFILNEDDGFVYDIELSNNITGVTFSWVPVNISIENFDIDKTTGMIDLIPTKKDVGSHSLFVIATTSQACFDMKKLTMVVYDKPTILDYYPSNKVVEIQETGHLKFSVKATTSLADDSLLYEWYLNNELVKTDKDYYSLFTNYTDAGVHYVKVIVKDVRNLNSSVEWRVKVKNKNRGPYLKYLLPSLVITNKTEGELYNIYNYIYDPDCYLLKFEAFFVKQNKIDVLENKSNIFNVDIDKYGEFSIYPKANIYITQYIRIRATDPEGLTFLSHVFSVRLAIQEDIIEVFVQRITVVKCEVNIVCGGWSECLPTNIKVRECYDSNNCDEQNKSILESQDCDYNATCFDNIKNQGEEQVDCGGPCEPCPTCNDGIWNQGEENIDCGGPCKPCPTCYDGILNQDESDIDCGGLCDKCLPGQSCAKHRDCDSLVCTDNICAESTCNDFRQNQGEERVDCGGPCEPCPTCNDGILNQNEEQVDCGGPCIPCETCYDGIKNQDEFFIDCGGPCEQCALIAFFFTAKNYWYVVLPFVGIILLIIIVKALFSSGGSNTFLVKLFNFLPKNLPDNSSRIIIDYINELNNVKKELFNSENKTLIAEHYKKSLNEFFSEMFEMEGTFTRGVLRSNIRSKIFNPFLTNVFVELYNQSLNVSPDAPLFKIELNQKIDESIDILNELRDLL